jgi:hypothetical protein
VYAPETLEFESLFEQIKTDERLSDMFSAAVDAAIATSSDAKIRLLGRAVAAGALAEDQAAIDEIEQLLRIAVELDPVDLRALRALERRRVPDAVAVVGYALDVGSAIAGVIVARLERLHLVRVERTAAIYDKQDPNDDSVDIDEQWCVTEAALDLLELLAWRGERGFSNELRPAGTRRAGFSRSQAGALESLADLSKYDWRRQPTESSPLARTLDTLEALNVPYARIREAMRSIGIGEEKLEQLDRWGARRSL